MTDYRKVPVDYMAGGVQRYIENGIPPGSFLRAIFSNDLKDAVRCADDCNIRYLPEWARFMYCEMPSESQGSPEKVAAWIAHGGLAGLLAKEEVK